MTMAPWGGTERVLGIPGYEDASVIGGGASSTVYRARDVALSRWVAIKVLHSDALDDPVRKRFKREGEITANLGRHPHIVQLFETGFTETGTPYVAMEYFEEGSIGDRLKKVGVFSVAQTFDIGAKIASAVSAAHQTGVLHRDIKPQNILLSQYGPALGDFGIAHVATNLEWSQSLEQLTPMHAAPEVLLGGASTVQSDIYSLGSTLYTMLAGRPPFAGNDYGTPLRFQAIMLEPVPPIAGAEVPPYAMDVLRHAMAKSPGERPTSADGFGADLQAVLRRAENEVSSGTTRSTRRASAAGALAEAAGPTWGPTTGNEQSSTSPVQSEPLQFGLEDRPEAELRAGIRLNDGTTALPQESAADHAAELNREVSDQTVHRSVSVSSAGESDSADAGSRVDPWLSRVLGRADGAFDKEPETTVHRRVRVERAKSVATDILPNRSLRKPAIVAAIAVLLAGAVVGVTLAATGSRSPLKVKEDKKPAQVVTAMASNLLTGHGWVTSDHPDQVMLVDSETGQLDYRLTVGGTGDPVTVVESGATALLVNGKTGEAGLIDIGALRVVNIRSLAPGGSLGSVDQQSDRSQVLPGPGGTFYVVHRQTGRIDVTNPVTSKTLATTTVGSTISPAVVTGGGLWTVNEKTGTLVRLDYAAGELHETEVGSPFVSAGDVVELSVVDGNPAILDETRGIFLTAPGGVPGPGISIPSDVRVHASLSPLDTGPVTPIASTGRVVLVAKGKAKIVDLKGRARDTLGAPVAFANRLFVPDFTTGQVVVLNDAGQQVGAPIDEAPHATAQLAVTIQSGALFINDPNSAKAFSVTGSGTAHLITKSVSPLKTAKTTKVTKTTKVKAKSASSSVPTTSTTTTTAPTTTTSRPSRSRTSHPSTAAAVPSAPQSFVAKPGYESVTLSWLPASDHRSPIKSYTIHWTGGGGGSRSLPASDTSVTITGLKDGTAYRFSLSARNAVGQGPVIKASPVTPRSAVPGPPASVVARAGSNGTVSLTWAAADGHGRPITSYLVLAKSATGKSFWIRSSSTSLTVTEAEGLTLGASYTFTVRSTSSGGTSGPSASSSAVTVHGPPVGVADLAAKVGANMITITWVCNPENATCSGGSPVTSFKVSVTPPGGSSPETIAAAPGTSDYTATIVQLTTYGYTVFVAACNALGCTTTELRGPFIPS